LELHMTNTSLSNNYKSEGFRIQRFEVVMWRVLVESIEVFTQSSIFMAQSTKVLVQLVGVLPQLVDELP
jgi:hypothetical protein